MNAGDKTSGGEGGIRSVPSSASADEHYTSVIIACVCADYKRFNSSVPVSTVSPIRCVLQ